MHRKTNLTHLILVGIVVVGLTPLMVTVDTLARIVFPSNRDGHVRNGFPLLKST